MKIIDKSVPVYRAWCYIQCHTLVKKEPAGTGSEWIGKQCMCDVLQLNLSTGNMRIRWDRGETTDLRIGGENILMQWTGLTDKQFNLIFEGDTGLFAGKMFEIKYWDKMMAFGLYFKSENTWLHLWEVEQDFVSLDITGNIYQL